MAIRNRFTALLLSLITIVFSQMVASRAEATQLTYPCGSLLQHPRVYISYWNWGPSTDTYGLEPLLSNFYAGIGGTQYPA